MSVAVTIPMTPTVPPAVGTTLVPHTTRTTVMDMIDYLTDFMGADPSPEANRVCKRAIQNGLKRVVNAHNWSYFYMHLRVPTNGFYDSVATGTGIQYQVSSGTYPFQVTLTGGTFPSWTAFGTFRIGLVTYDVDRFISPTICTLVPMQAAAADMAAGTAFTLYRDTYPLPHDFVATDEGFADVSWGSMEYVHPNVWLRTNRYYQSYSNTPRYYCVPDDHEILTQRGWKKLRDLQIGEPVMAYNHDSEELAWQPLQSIHSFYFNGDLLSLERKKGGKQFLFTDEHRWPVQMRKGGARKMLRSYELTGASLIPQRGQFRSRGRSILTPRLAAILGWLVTDGTGLFTKKHWDARVYQHPRKYLKEIVALLGTKERKPNRQGVVAVGVAKEDRAALRKVVRSVAELPALVGKLSREAAEAMWTAMFHAEGWTTKKTGQQGFAQYTERNVPVIEAFQILSIMTGRVAHIGIGKDGRRACTIGKTRYLSPAKNGGLKRVPYTGTIWCPKTEWGTWVMRHNGHVIITGNTIMGNPKVGNGLCLRIFPYPDQDRTIDSVYKRRSREVTLDKYETGTVTIDSVNAPQTVIGAGTQWAASMVGSVLRVSGTKDPPTGWTGSNPAVLERNLTTFVSNGNMAFDDLAPNSFTAATYRISDPIDIEDGAMLELFYRACELEIAIERRMKELPTIRKFYSDYLVTAKEADSRVFAARVAGVGGPYRQRMARMPSGPDVP
jgi:hypothetical protein